MLQLALREYPEFILDCRELERDGPSWTVLTLQSFRQQFPDDSLCLVMGSDAFAGLPTWYHWQKILQLAHIIVIERAGEQILSMPEWAAEYWVDELSQLRDRAYSGITSVCLTGYDISATEIRNHLHQKQGVAGMLSKQVIDYIHRNKLYSNDK